MLICSADFLSCIGPNVLSLSHSLSPRVSAMCVCNECAYVRARVSVCMCECVCVCVGGTFNDTFDGSFEVSTPT